MKRLCYLSLTVVALSGCERPMETEQYTQERLARDVTEAMCASDQASRADALRRISAKSEGFPLTEVSDEVADIADRIAEEGCPATT